VWVTHNATEWRIRDIEGCSVMASTHPARLGPSWDGEKGNALTSFRPLSRVHLTAPNCKWV